MWKSFCGKCLYPDTLTNVFNNFLTNLRLVCVHCTIIYAVYIFLYVYIFTFIEFCPTSVFSVIKDFNFDTFVIINFRHTRYMWC
jgi:hypothetical protein